MSFLELDRVERIYVRGTSVVSAVREVSFEVARQEFVAIMGPSGSGKSTLMNLIGLLDRPTAGSIRFTGHDVDHMSDDDMASLRGQAIGFVFQSYHLLPRLTALENVAMPLVYARMPRKESLLQAAASLESVGMIHRAKHRPNQLSGGEQQRVAIARALVRDPALLLADEPTGALDSRTGAEILDLFHRLHHGGRTIVMITHDPRLATECGRVIKVRDGRLA